MTTDVLDRARAEVDAWYESCRDPRSGRVAKYVVDIGLVVLEQYRHGAPLSPHHLVTPGAQVRGASRAAVARILGALGLAAVPRTEGGRTAPGAVPAALALAGRLDDLVVEHGPPACHLVSELQRHLVSCDPLYLQAPQLQIMANDSATFFHVIHALVEAGFRDGRETGRRVAYYLVGSKLELRFAAQAGATACVRETRTRWDADAHPDYEVGDTRIFVTDFPGEDMLRRIAASLRSGWQTLVIVPESTTIATRQYLAGTDMDNRVAVCSLEQFLGQNLSELGGFDRGEMNARLRELLTTYNRRISASEPSAGLEFQIPRWLSLRR